MTNIPSDNTPKKVNPVGINRITEHLAGQNAKKAKPKADLNKSDGISAAGREAVGRLTAEQAVELGTLAGDYSADKGIRELIEKNGALFTEDVLKRLREAELDRDNLNSALDLIDDEAEEDDKRLNRTLTAFGEADSPEAIAAFKELVEEANQQ